MMKNIRLVGIGVLVLVAGVALGAPYVIGKKVEQRFRTAVDDLSVEAGQKIEITRYERHWFGASARTVITLDDTTLAMDHDIQHGPWPNLAWANVDSHPVLTGANEVHDLFDGPPVTLTSRFGMGGGYTIDIDSPAASGELTSQKGEAVQIEWRGLEGTLSMADHRARAQISVPGLRFASGDRQVELRGMRMRGDGWDTDALIESADKWASSGVLSVDEIVIRGKDDMSVSLGAELASETTTPGNDEFAYVTRLRLHDMKASGLGGAPVTIASAGLSVEFAGLKLTPLRDMLQAMQQFERRTQQADNVARERAAEQIGRIASQYVPQILAGSPTFTIALPAVKTDRGQLGARLEFALAPSVGEASAAPANMLARTMQRAAVEASAFVDNTLLAWGVTRLDQPDRARQTIDQLVEQKLLVAGDDRLSTRVYYDIDTLRINGQEAPPGMAQALLQGMTGASGEPTAGQSMPPEESVFEVQ